MKYLTLTFVLLLGAAACSSGSSSSAPGPDKPTGITGVQTFSGLSHNHTTTLQTYPTKPPVGGPHWPPSTGQVRGWQQCGVAYTEPVVDEFAVHSLEHGAVWLTYAATATAADVSQLSQLGQIRPDYELVSPYPGQPSVITATAWGAQLGVESATDPRLAEFVRTYAGGGQGGEPGADCAHGSTIAQARAALSGHS